WEGEVGGLVGLEDGVDIGSSEPVRVDQIRSVRDQAAVSDEVAGGVDRRQFMLGRKRDDQFAMNGRQTAPRHDQATVGGARECSDGALELAGIPDVYWVDLYP